MGKSLNRVMAALTAAGADNQVVAMKEPTRTAAQAASAAGCDVDQIAKSILFLGETSGALYLFITAGGREVCADLATSLADEPLGKADAAIIRKITGFAIGGVSPVGHLTQPKAYFDKRLLDFPIVWAAAGTPNHIFSSEPNSLLTLSGAELADFTK